MIRRATFILFLILFGLGGTISSSWSQDVIANYRTLSIEDGLNFRKVNTINQDPSGLLWIGTNLGLQFYDGYNFSNFEYSGSGDRFKSVNDIERSATGEMFLSTSNGVLKYDVFEKAFHALPFVDKPSSPFIKKLVIMDEGVLYAIGLDRVYVYENGAFVGMQAFPVSSVPEIANHFIYSERIDSSRVVFMCDQYDVIYDVGKKTISTFKSRTYKAKESRGRRVNKRYRILQDGNEVFIDRNGQIIDLTSLEPRLDYNNSDHINYQFSVILDEHNLYKYKESNKFNLSKNEKQELAFEIENTSGLRLFDYFQDYNGDHLLATNFGIIILQVRKSIFQKLLNQENPKDLYNSSIRKIVKTVRGNLFFSQGSILKLTSRDSVLQEQELKRALMDYERISDSIYFAVSPAGSNLIKVGDDRFSILEDYDIRGFVCYSLDSSFLVGGSGITEYHIHTKEILGSIGPKTDQVRAFQPLGNGNFYVGSRMGLTEYDKNFSVIRQLLNQSKSGFDQQNINDIYIDDEGVIWLATQGNGVLCLDADFNILNRINKLNGLPNDVVYSINFDGEHYWFPTDYGLVKYDPMTGFVVNYFEEDGISNNEFNRYAHLVTDEGDIYLGTLNGIVEFKKNKTQKKVSQLKLFISEIYLSDGRDKDVGSLIKSSTHSSIKLTERNGYAQVRFGISDFMSPKDHKYAYRLSKNENWISIGNKNTVELLNLAAGTYDLEIMAKSREGQEVKSAMPIKIRSIPPIYKRWWFYVIATLLASIILYQLYRWRLRQMEKVQKVKRNISKDLHDEVGSMLTEITILTDVARNVDQGSEREEFLEQISQKGRDAISAMSDVIWTIDTSSSTLEDLITRMNQVMRNLLSPVDISFNIEKNKLDVTKVLPINSKKNLYLIFKEAIHNVVKHSNATGVLVELKQNNDSFQMIIYNDKNKSDFKKINTSGNNLGLKSMQDRAAVLEGAVSFSENDDGFVVKLRIPRL